VVTTKGGRILGAGIAGEHAGELIAFWALALTRKMNISAVTSVVLPYPTLSEIGKRAAYLYYAPRLTSPLLRRIIRLLRRFG
jgi:pyruvate/2-oxoglutarate dehydrogenase complex dihydrolipoamide dehydrogenase (E3) component